MVAHLRSTYYSKTEKKKKRNWTEFKSTIIKKLG